MTAPNVHISVSDDSEASDDIPNNESDSDSHESDFDNTDSEWVDVTESHDNQPQANLQYQELHGPRHASPLHK
jgi:hypothetical protein